MDFISHHVSQVDFSPAQFYILLPFICQPLINTLHTKLYLSTASEPPSLGQNEPETIHRHRHPDKQQRPCYKSPEIFSIQYKVLGQMGMWKRYIYILHCTQQSIDS